MNRNKKKLSRKKKAGRERGGAIVGERFVNHSNKMTYAAVRKEYVGWREEVGLEDSVVYKEHEWWAMCQPSEDSLPAWPA